MVIDSVHQQVHFHAVLHPCLCLQLPYRSRGRSYSQGIYQGQKSASVLFHRPGLDEHTHSARSPVSFEWQSLDRLLHTYRRKYSERSAYGKTADTSDDLLFLLLVVRASLLDTQPHTGYMPHNALRHPGHASIQYDHGNVAARFLRLGLLGKEWCHVYVLRGWRSEEHTS